MKYIFILSGLFFLLISSDLAAQSNHLQGYIILNSGDTLRGLIDYRQWRKNPAMIKMKTGSALGQSKTFTVNEISAFEIDGLDAYERASVLIDMTPESLVKLNPNVVYARQADTVFLRVLLKSKTSLYEFVNEKIHYYVREEGKDYIELMHNFSITDDNRLNKSIEYKKQLARLTSGTKNLDDDLYADIEKAEYKEKDIVKIVEKVNQLSKAITHYRPKPIKVRISSFVGGGLIFSAMKFKGAASPDVSKLKYSNSYQPLINVGVNFPMSRNRGNVVLRADLTYYRQNYEGTGNKSNSFSGTDSLNYELVISHLAPSFSALYNVINFPDTKFYLGGGAAFNFSAYPTNRYTIINGFSSSKTELDTYLLFEKFWVGLNAKAGYVFQNRYELATIIRAVGSFANFSGFGVTPTTVGLNLNYHFRK